MSKKYEGSLSSFEECGKCGGLHYEEYSEIEEESFCLSCGSSYELAYRRDEAEELILTSQVFENPEDVMMQIWDFEDSEDRLIFEQPLSPEMTAEQILAFLTEDDRLPQGERVLSSGDKQVSQRAEGIVIELEPGRLIIRQPELVKTEVDGYGVLCRLLDGKIKEMVQLDKMSKADAMKKMEEEELPVVYLTWWNDSTESIEVLYGEVMC